MLFGGIARANKDSNNVEFDITCRFLYTEVPKVIDFVFPERLEWWEQRKPGTVEKHMFLLSGEKALWGFVRRLWTKQGGAVVCEFVVVLSEMCWPNVMHLVVEWQSRDMDDFSLARKVLSEPLPGPGKLFEVPAGCPVLRVPRTRYFYGELNILPLLERFRAEVTAQLLCALMMERRVIFVSSECERLSCYIHIMLSLLYPFKFEYTCIPLLPSKLYEYCMATFPFVIGIHRSVLAHVKKLKLEEIVFVDCDSGEVSFTPADRLAFPQPQIATFLSVANKARSEPSSLHRNMALQDAVMDFFASVLAPLPSCFVAGVFDKDAFLREVSRTCRPFADHLIETQMWTCFVHRLREGEHEDFTRRCALQLEQNGSVVSSYLKSFAEAIGTSPKKSSSSSPSVSVVATPQSPFASNNAPKPSVPLQLQNQPPPPVPARPKTTSKEFTNVHQEMRPPPSAKDLLDLDAADVSIPVRTQRSSTLDLLDFTPQPSPRDTLPTPEPVAVAPQQKDLMSFDVLPAGIATATPRPRSTNSNKATQSTMTSSSGDLLKFE